MPDFGESKPYNFDFVQNVALMLCVTAKQQCLASILWGFDLRFKLNLPARNITKIVRLLLVKYFYQYPSNVA